MSLISQTIARPATQSKILYSEVDPLLSRKRANLRGGSGNLRTVIVGTLLGAIFVGATTTAIATAAAANSGGGVLTLADPAFGEAVQKGIYVIRCTKPGGAGVAEFNVEKPDGKELKAAVDGTAYDGTHLKFTIAAAGADFIVGDSFTVEVTTTDGKPTNSVVAWDPDGTDGRQKLWGVSLVNATAADNVDNIGGIDAITRLGVIKASGIEWPDGISEQDKNEALSWLDDQLSIVAI